MMIYEQNNDYHKKVKSFEYYYGSLNMLVSNGSHHVLAAIDNIQKSNPLYFILLSIILSPMCH